MDAYWTARELSGFIKVPVSTLTYWVAAGLVTPDESGKGRGGHKIGLLGLLEALAVKELRRSDVPLQKIREVAANLKRLFDQNRPLARLTLIVYGDDVIVMENGIDNKGISAYLKPGQSVMIFPLGEAYVQKVEEVEETKKQEKQELVTV